MPTTHPSKLNTSIIIGLLLVILNVAGLVQCGSESNVPREYREILELPIVKKREAIKKLPLEKQVDVYVWGLNSEPPDTSLASALAENGKAIIPVLLKRLTEEKDERVKPYLIYVFADIHLSHYNLKNDKQTVETLKRTVSEMKDPNNKFIGEQYLKLLDSYGVNEP